MLWNHEIGELPSHREARFRLAPGLPLPVRDRLPGSGGVRQLSGDGRIAWAGAAPATDLARAPSPSATVPRPASDPGEEPAPPVRCVADAA